MATVSAKLPAPLTRFVGRETELAQAATLLAGARLLTLTGPGGAGKTRLALRLASTVADDFPDGVWFVDLSPLSGGQLVWDQVAMTLGVDEPGPGGTWAEAVGSRLAAGRALVVLDNCEHVVESAAEVAAALLAAAPELKAIATSREPLQVGGEVTWAVPPLSEADGFELFSDRAHLARPQLRLGEDDTQAVHSICRRLDGLPLAIELAAARTRLLAPAQIAARLKDRFELLPTGPRTAPGRQATLRASFEWSYELLSEAERTVLRQLSVFVDGFDLEAALDVCPGANIELVAALADRSLIRLDDKADEAEPRYRMLETVREFAAERLADAKEVELLRTRHRDHYLALAETTKPLLLGPDEDRWRARLRLERDNFRAALGWSRDRGQAEALARMVAGLIWFWMVPGRITEFGMWVDAAMDRVGELSPSAAAQILNFECILAVVSRRQVDKVPALAGEALTLARAGGAKGEEALALSMLGLVAGLGGGANAMRPYIEKALPLARSAGFALGLVLSLVAFVMLRMFQSNPEEGRHLAEEAVAVAEAGADRHNRLFASSFAGLTALVDGRLADAAQIFETVVAAGRPTNDSNFMGSLLGLAWVAMFRGDFQSAQEYIAEALPAAQRRGTDSLSITSVEPLARFIRAWMELARGNAAQATQTLAVVVAVTRSSIAARFACLPLVVLAQAQLALGEDGEAAALLDEATSLASAGAMTWALGRVARVRAELRARQGDLKEAESLAHEAVALARGAGDQLGLVDAFELLARLAGEQGSHREAVRLWAAAESRRSELGYARFPAEQSPREAAVAAAKDTLGADGFAVAWDEGAKLSVEEAIAYAARGRGERKRPSTGWASLTPSEVEVVRLVGQHLSNREVAAQLFVSRATVKTHLVHIFSKL
ncbi:MAG TPA: LuxR C-terminal-related transcriptional regulator, partial [Candidatus Dormibacteraeota bacterium]